MTLTREMTTRSRNPHVGPIGREQEIISRNSRVVTADSRLMNEADFADHFARTRRIDNLYRDNLDVLSVQDVDRNIEDGPDRKERIPTKKNVYRRKNLVMSLVAMDRITMTYVV